LLTVKSSPQIATRITLLANALLLKNKRNEKEIRTENKAISITLATTTKEYIQ